MTRNLIYTAVTRAKKCVCLVGLPEMFQFMVENEMEQKRYSGLKDPDPGDRAGPGQIEKYINL